MIIYLRSRVQIFIKSVKVIFYIITFFKPDGHLTVKDFRGSRDHQLTEFTSQSVRKRLIIRKKKLKIIPFPSFAQKVLDKNVL